MAKKKQVGRRLEGWKAKKWYRVYVPDAFGKVEIGDAISADPANMVGRVMTATLGEVVQDYSKSHIKMRFKINDVAGDAAYTEFIGHEVTRDYLRSMVKRRASRIDTIHPVVSKDGKLLRVTVVCLTLSRPIRARSTPCGRRSRRPSPPVRRRATLRPWSRISSPATWPGTSSKS